MKKIYRFLTLMCVIFCYSLAYAGNYTVKKGSTITVNCTASAPAGGWITNAYFSIVNAEDREYLACEYTSSDLRATFYGLKPKSNIKVEVTYAYSYRGSYDNNIQVGHGSYYDYISVTGAPSATGLSFREGEQIYIRPGESRTLHVDLHPKGADGYVSWGFVDGFGKPFNFELNVNDDGLSAIVTAKKESYVYLIAMVDNDQTKSDVIEIICDENVEMETPTSLSLSPTSQTFLVGEKHVFSPIFTPSNAWAELTWKSSNTSVALVDEEGVVTGISSGTATIMANSLDNKLVAEAKVTILQPFTGFKLPSEATVNLGFSYSIEPVLTPAKSYSDLSWNSSDNSIATVSASGVVTAKSEGTCIVTAKSKLLNRNESINITVKRPSSPVTDHRNLRQRIQAVKSLFTRTIINN